MKSEILNVNTDIQSEEMGEILLTASDKNIQDMNKIVAEGTIIHRHDFEKVTFIKLIVLGGKKRDIRNFPSFLLMGTVKDKASDFKKGDKVRIEAYCRSQKTKNGEEDEFKQTLVVSDIKLAQSILEQDFGKNGRIYELPFAQFKVVGNIVKVTILRNNVIKFIIHSITDGNFSSYIEYTMFARDLVDVAECLKIGTKVCAAGEIQTKELEKNDSKKFMQQNVILDIKKVK